MVKVCPADVTRQSNADSVVVAELAICCHLSPGARRAESEGQNALEGEDNWHTCIHKLTTLLRQSVTAGGNGKESRVTETYS